MDLAKGQTTGFDYLRISLSIGVLVWHSIWFSGQQRLNDHLWYGNFRFLGSSLVPVFFALSGFLVSASLLRSTLPQFVTLRIIRLIPALAVEVVLSATVLGMAFTTLPIGEYLANPEFHSYFLNVLGIVHFKLPGVFESNPGGPWINAQLWTIPFELECYLALVLLSVFAVIRKKAAFAATIAAVSIGMSAWCVAHHSISPQGNPPGRVMVLCFLAAVSLYLNRDRVPYSNALGVASTIALIFTANHPNTAYLMAFPAAYTAVWIGLMRLPKIPFGDLSYGIYLFHLPVEQMLVHLFPSVSNWWTLTLVSFPVVMAVAWLSWTCVEAPIMSRKKQIVLAVDRYWKSAFSNRGASTSN